MSAWAYIKFLYWSQIVAKISPQWFLSLKQLFSCSSSPTNPPDLIIDNSSPSSHRPITSAKVFSLTRRVFDRVAALVGPHHNPNSNSLVTSSSSSSSSPKLSKKAGLTKTKSLERHFDCRIDKASTALAREQARFETFYFLMRDVIKCLNNSYIV